MFDRPRNWKWMVPAGLIAPCLVWWNAWVMWGETWRDWAIFPLGIAVILSIATLINLYVYVQHYTASIYADIQAARNSTPEVRMFEAAKGMHPQAVEALLIHRRAIWRIKYVPLKDLADWVLDEAPTVHAGFLDFVLDHSPNGSLMSKRLLSEGAKQFDPEGLVADYQQYDDLLLLMQQKLMCTQALGNQTPQFLPPWNAELIRHRFGVDGEQYMVEAMSEAMKSIQRAQKWTKSAPALPGENGNGKSVIDQALEDLEQTQAMKARTKQLSGS